LSVDAILLTAFEYFLKIPLKFDKQCRGNTYCCVSIHASQGNTCRHHYLINGVPDIREEKMAGKESEQRLMDRSVEMSVSQYG